LLFAESAIIRVNPRLELSLGFSGNRSVGAAKQFCEPSICSQAFQMWVNANEGEAHCVLTLSLCQPAERVIALSKQTIDDRYLVRCHPLFRALSQNLFQNRSGLVLLAGRC
jgi:hypothetical protein